MPTTRAAKEKFVSDIHALASNALLTVTANYRGLSAVELSDLRMRASACGVSVRVLKNTLAKRALLGTAYEHLCSELTGPLLVAFSHTEQEPGAAARVLRDYCKDDKKLEIKSVSLAHQNLSPADIHRLADLPTRAEAVAQLMGLVHAPVVRLATALHQLPARLVRVIAAYADQNQEPGR